MNLTDAARRSAFALACCATIATAHAQEASVRTEGKPPGPSAPPPATSSLILTTITVPIGVIGQALEKAVPKTGSGTVQDPIKNPVVINDVLTWSFTRSALTTKGQKGAILVSSAVSGTTHLKGTVRLIRGDLRRFIGGGIPDIPFSGTTTIRATSSSRAQPKLLPDWRVQPNLTMTAQVQQATVPIKGVGTVSIKGQVQSQFDARLADLRKQLETKMHDDKRIEAEARKAWDSVCRAHPLDIDQDGRNDLYLRITPIAARAAQPSIDEHGLAQQIGIEARTEVGHDATKPDCPFPATVQIEPMDEPRFEIALPVEIGFEQLNAILATQLPTTVENAEHGLKAEIRKVTVGAGDARRLSLLIEGSVAETRPGAKAFPSTFIMRATPKLDAARQRITFENAELDPKSMEVFGLTGVLARAAARVLEGQIADIAIDIGKEAARLPELAEAAVRTLNQAKGADVEVAARFDPPRLVGLEFDSRQIRLIAQARGRVTATVKAVKLD